MTRHIVKQTIEIDINEVMQALNISDKIKTIHYSPIYNGLKFVKAQHS